MSNLINLVVVNLNDGGDLSIERDEVEESWNDFVEENEGDISYFEKSLEDGLKECDDYFNGYGERSEEDKKEWNELKENYKKMVEGKNGKFYVWGIEYDCDLMFVEE